MPVLKIGKPAPSKPRFRINVKPLSPFQQLVKEALAVWRRLDQLRVPGGDSKLSCRAFLHETLRIDPAATEARVRKLRAKLESGDPALLNTQGALRAMVKEIKGPFVRTPPKAATWPRIERFFLRPRVTEVLGELTKAGYTSVELFGAAILIAGDKHPEVFGTADSMQQEIDSEVETLTKKRDELLTRIERSWTAEDVNPGEYVQGRTSPARFKGTDVHVAPPEGSGKRLIEYLLSHRS